MCDGIGRHQRSFDGVVRPRAGPRFHPAAVAAVLAGALLSGGCASQFSETHYFRSKKDPANYYKLRVHGGTFLASSRYISGYFDEDAVNNYFNEMSQPANGQLIPAPSTASAPGTGAGGGANAVAAAPGQDKPDDDDDAGIKPVGAAGNYDNRILVMILSSNSDEIATQIGAFAQNRATSATLGRIINRDRLGDQRSASSQLARVQESGKLVAAIGDKAVKALEGAENAPAPEQVERQEEARRNVLQFVNQAARELGRNEAPFATMADARTWLQANRQRLVND